MAPLPDAVPDFGMARALVQQLLVHAADHPWRMQEEVGLLGLRLDDHRMYRLHIWDRRPDLGEPPIHDHPYDFVSTVVAGELVNTRYIESPAGAEYRRIRYLPSDEQARTTDAVRLTSASATIRAGASYTQLAHELHDSRQQPGTVTILRMDLQNVDRLTVCLRPGDGFVSGRARAATLDEVKRITSNALELF